MLRRCVDLAISIVERRLRHDQWDQCGMSAMGRYQALSAFACGLRCLSQSFLRMGDGGHLTVVLEPSMALSRLGMSTDQRCLAAIGLKKAPHRAEGLFEMKGAEFRYRSNAAHMAARS